MSTETSSVWAFVSDGVGSSVSDAKSFVVLAFGEGLSFLFSGAKEAVSGLRNSWLFIAFFWFKAGSVGILIFKFNIYQHDRRMTFSAAACNQPAYIYRAAHFNQVL